MSRGALMPLHLLLGTPCRLLLSVLTAGRFGEGIDGCAPCSGSSATIRHYRLRFSSPSAHFLFTPLASRIAVCRIGQKHSEEVLSLGLHTDLSSWLQWDLTSMESS